MWWLELCDHATVTVIVIIMHLCWASAVHITVLKMKNICCLEWVLQHSSPSRVLLLLWLLFLPSTVPRCTCEPFRSVEDNVMWAVGKDIVCECHCGCSTHRTLEKWVSREWWWKGTTWPQAGAVLGEQLKHQSWWVQLELQSWHALVCPKMVMITTNVM